MAGALSAPGPGRFAGADAVVRADPTVDDRRRTRRDGRRPGAAARRRRSCGAVPGGVGDVSFPVGAFDAAAARSSADLLAPTAGRARR